MPTLIAEETKRADLTQLRELDRRYAFAELTLRRLDVPVLVARDELGRQVGAGSRRPPSDCPTRGSLRARGRRLFRRCRGRGRMIVMTVTDALARQLRDLRISVTDRCNFRCVYCMPREVFGRDYEFLERAELLTFEEIERLARIFVGDHGVEKIRLTGGEPLVRREVERLVEMLARIPGSGDPGDDHQRLGAGA
jgi:sulfatase maturation enzyme AslB (radical SAM superfamily)